MAGSSDQDRVRCHPGSFIIQPPRHSFLSHPPPLLSSHTPPTLLLFPLLLSHLNPLTPLLRHFFPYAVGFFSTLSDIRPIIIAEVCMTKFFPLALKKSSFAILRPPASLILILSLYLVLFTTGFFPLVFPVFLHTTSRSQRSLFIFTTFIYHAFLLSLFQHLLFFNWFLSFFRSSFHRSLVLPILFISFVLVCNVISLCSNAFVIAMSFTYKYIYAHLHNPTTQTGAKSQKKKRRRRDRSSILFLWVGLAEVKPGSPADAVLRRR